ncbi:hypothetical protein WDU94_005431 [Cyamophila willieti]
MNRPQLPERRNLVVHESDSCRSPCDCTSIEVVENAKYLGLELDCFLKWDKHIDILTKRLRRYIYPFLALRNFLSLPLLMEIYHALVQSALEYGISAYGRADKTTLHKLETIQKCLLKIIYKKEKRYPTKDLFKELKVLDINKLLTKNVCTYVHRNKTELIQYTEHSYQLRTKNLKIDRFKTSKGQKSINYEGIKQYYKLPDSLKDTIDTKKFKLELKTWLKTGKIK